MRQDGIEISSKAGKSVFDLFTRGSRYDAVITVCSPVVGEKCPVFPGRVLRLHWPFADPATFVGTEEEILVQVHHVRDLIKESVLRFISEYKEKGIKLFI
jgi:arsenate reductase